MTDREAIEIIENGGWWDLFIPITTVKGRNEEIKLHQALDMAISSLQEREERSKGCEFCNIEANKNAMIEDHGYAVCPYCGRPLKGDET